MREEKDKKEKEDCPLCNVSEETIKRLKEQKKFGKKEKYLLKRQKKEQERLLKVRQKKIRKIIKLSSISLIVILIIGGVVFGTIKFFKGRNFGTPKIEIVSLEYNAGTVSMADGLVKHTYEIKNTGEGDLKIKSIWTSCMCTTVRLRIGDKLSPEFNMHSNNSLWSEKIAPGETGYLEVVFDPAFHGPGGTGPVARAVYISTNDPDNKDTELLLLADVIE